MKYLKNIEYPKKISISDESVEGIRFFGVKVKILHNHHLSPRQQLAPKNWPTIT